MMQWRVSHRASPAACAIAAMPSVAEAAARARKDALEETANIAMAINSGRGNETEIAKAIRALMDKTPPPTQED